MFEACQIPNFFKSIVSRLSSRGLYIVLTWLILLITMNYFMNFENIPYQLMASIGIISTIIILFIGNNLESNAFIIIIIFGLFYSFTMPIQDNPDEHAHLARTLYLSEGNFGMTDNPNKLKISRDYELIGAEFGTNGDGLKTQYHSDDTIPVEIITATSTNFFISYIPQAIGLTIGKVLNLNLYWTYFLGRIFNLIAYGLIIRKAISFSGQWKLPLTFVSLSPMSIFLAASYNQDSVALGLIILAISYFIHMSSQKDGIGKKNILIYSILCILIGITKLPYVALIGLLLFVPKERFVSKNPYRWIVSSIAVVGFITLLWLLSYLGITPVHKPASADTMAQLKFLLGNWTTSLQILVNAILNNINNYLMMFQFGWLSYGSVEIAMAYLFFFGAITLFFPVKNDFPKLTKIGITLIGIAIMILINLSQYLTWTEVGLNYINGVQGRYFIGVHALMPLGLNLSRKLKIKYDDEMMINNIELTVFTTCLVIFFLVAMLSCQIGQYNPIYN